MDVVCEHKNAMTLIGYHTEIAPDEGSEKCPLFWEEEYTKKYARLWQTMQPQTAVEQAILDNQIGMYGLCVDGKDGFTYWIAGEYKGGDVPEGLQLFTLPAGDWAVFSAQGPMPESLQSLNAAVWQDWLPTKGRDLGADTDLAVEVYSAGDMLSPDYTCGMWIPLRNNQHEAGEDWRRLYEAAKAVQKERRVSEYVSCGEVAAAIMSKNGRIYTGVCVDTCSTLGICAERNAIFNMITNGEQELDKVLAVMPDGKTGAPCGACRELMVQLMPDSYRSVEIMLDYETGRVVTLGELTPEWWI